MEFRHYAIALVLLLALDAVWLAANRRSYDAMVVRVQGSAMQVRVVAAIAAYALMYVGLVGLVLPQLMASSRAAGGTKRAAPSLLKVLRVAGLYGLTVYGIYNATNFAIFKRYPLSVAIMDTAWGTFIYTLVAWLVTRI